MSTSPSSSEEVGGRDGGRGGDGGGELEGPSISRSRRRFGNRVWPAPFLEALAAQVSTDASRFTGRRSAAPALCSLFQVLSACCIYNAGGIILIHRNIPMCVLCTLALDNAWE